MSRPLLRASAVSIDAPSGRRLFSELSLILERGERVAVVGRNGVGKSTLLEVLSGAAEPASGRILCEGDRRLVRQELTTSEGTASPGESRRARLRRAFDRHPDLLLLDEPTQDLDSPSIHWLISRLERFRGGLLVVSHCRLLLREFGVFLVVSETGCWPFLGGLDALTERLEERRATAEQRYLASLRRQLAAERKSAVVRSRRQRKKNLGRLHEIGRCPSRAALNKKRSYAQESQGKRAVQASARLESARRALIEVRSAVPAELALRLGLPEPGPLDDRPVVRLEGVSVRIGSRGFFDGLSLELVRDRIAITGANGAGKSLLLSVISGRRAPNAGEAFCAPERTALVAQGCRGWRHEHSVANELQLRSGLNRDEVLSVLRAHRFPLALARRPMNSLSPGERVRGALICIYRRRPLPELLVLDEPTAHLDFLGVAALEEALRLWPGALVVASHDEVFLDAIGVQRRIALDAGELASSRSVE